MSAAPESKLEKINSIVFDMDAPTWKLIAFLRAIDMMADADGTTESDSEAFKVVAEAAMHEARQARDLWQRAFDVRHL